MATGSVLLGWMWSQTVKDREDPVTQARHLARRLLRKQLPER
jgi:hypothetical protein